MRDREKLLPMWESKVKYGDALEKYYAQMMIDITADGPLERFCPELARLMVEDITVHGVSEMTVRFKDGSERRVRV